MMKEYQVTLFSTTGKYRPVSAIVRKNDLLIEEMGKDKFIKSLKNDGIVKICQKRGWSKRELIEYGFLKVSVRVYDKEKIMETRKRGYKATTEQDKKTPNSKDSRKEE